MKKTKQTKNYETKIKIIGYSKKIINKSTVRETTKRMPAKDLLQ